MAELPRFRGVHNIRDVGGLETLSGRLTRTGVLYRSDSWHGADADDVEALLAATGLRLVVDLRSSREVNRDGLNRFFPESVQRLHFALDVGLDVSSAGAATGNLLAFRYLEYLRNCGNEVAAAVASVADSSGPVMIHCRAGKDRTGAVVALILAVVGVTAQEIARDYERTSAGMPKIREQLRDDPVYAANGAGLPDEMYSAEAATMSTFLEAVSRTWGSPEEYLTDRGLDSRVLNRLRGRLST
jgi:protein-tyrosine phosphatase